MHDMAAEFTTDFTYEYYPRQWKQAWRGLKSLMADKEDTDQVFVIMRALTGRTQCQQFEKLIKHEDGRAIIKRRLDLIDTLRDREYLASLPEGSLGRVYLDFIVSENLNADALVTASEGKGRDIVSKDYLRYLTRIRDVHDLWHVITGYGRDGLGEACLVAFSYAQIRSMGFAAIAILAMHKFRQLSNERVIRAVWQAYRQGKKTNWLPAVIYEDILAEPLTKVRQDLNIPVPLAYLACPETIAISAA